LNLGMLLAEMQRPADAEQAFRRCLALDPNAAVAAYNLAVLLAPDRPYESLRWCQRAWQVQPQEGKYGYTYAYFLHQRRETDEAVRVLGLVRRKVPAPMPTPCSAKSTSSAASGPRPPASTARPGPMAV
jgi:Flp pilus assembly protein TadD